MFSYFRLRPDTGTGTVRSTVVLWPKSQNLSLQTSAHRDAIVLTDFFAGCGLERKHGFMSRCHRSVFSGTRPLRCNPRQFRHRMNVSLESVLQYWSKAGILLSSPGFKHGLTINGIAWREWKNKVSHPKASLRALAYPCWHACNTHPCRHIPCNLAGVC